MHRVNIDNTNADISRCKDAFDAYCRDRNIPFPFNSTCELVPLSTKVAVDASTAAWAHVRRKHDAIVANEVNLTEVCPIYSDCLILPIAEECNVVIDLDALVIVYIGKPGFLSSTIATVVKNTTLKDFQCSIFNVPWMDWAAYPSKVACTGLCYSLLGCVSPHYFVTNSQLSKESFKELKKNKSSIDIAKENLNSMTALYKESGSGIVFVHTGSSYNTLWQTRIVRADVNSAGLTTQFGIALAEYLRENNLLTPDECAADIERLFKIADITEAESKLLEVLNDLKK